MYDVFKDHAYAVLNGFYNNLVIQQGDEIYYLNSMIDFIIILFRKSFFALISFLLI